MANSRTIAFHTLGCKLNFSETSTLTRLMEKEGFEKREFEDQADIYVINTCSVTENADRECRQLVRRIQRHAPESLVVVTGCYAQLKPHEIASIPGVDLVLGAAEKFNLAEHIRDLGKTDEAKICSCDIDEVTGFNPSFSFNDRTRSFLKVQDGCNYNCSFCTIPQARGKSRSGRIASLVEQVEELGRKGVKEVVLTGVNLGDFGRGPEGSDENAENFFDLVRELDKMKVVERFRISSIEPNLLGHEIIDWVAESKRFMPHFHIPLQSGSNRILGMMRRRYKRELYADRVKHIRERMPHCSIGVDVIVGFPGESDDDFRETACFLEQLDVSYFHVFTYSERENTHALSLKPVVPMRIRQERNKILRTLSYHKMQQFISLHKNQTRPVLFESHSREGIIEGYTDNYIRVSAPYKKEWANRVVDWKL